MARRLIGSGTTDVNGRVSITYTGTGVGKLQLVAEYGELSSQVYDLWDLLFYDSGFEDSTSLTAKWTLGSAVSRSVGDNGTTLTINDRNTSTSNQYTNTTFSGDFEAIIYVENESSSVGVRFGVTNGTSTSSPRRYFARSGNTYLKLVRENGVTTGYTSDDGETWTQRDMNGTEPSSSSVYVYIGMYIPTGTASMSFTYNDLKIYSI